MSADIIWTVRNAEFDVLKWSIYILMNMILTLVTIDMIFIHCSRITHSYKLVKISFVLLFIIYYQICILNQVHVFAPGQSWDDSELSVPVLKISMSLRSLMMSSLGNLTLFMGKQFALMVRHLNRVPLPIYPKLVVVDTTSS